MEWISKEREMAIDLIKIIYASTGISKLWGVCHEAKEATQLRLFKNREAVRITLLPPAHHPQPAWKGISL